MEGPVPTRAVWYDQETKDKVVYEGKLRKLKKRDQNVYFVTYWTDVQPQEDGEDYEMSRAADLVDGDLTM